MSDEPQLIEITQNEITTPLKDAFFSPASSHFDGKQTWVIESSISASCDMVLQDGEAELSYGEQTFTVEVTVLEFDEDADAGDLDEPDDGDVADEDAAVCHIMIDSDTLELEKLAAFLDLVP